MMKESMGEGGRHGLVISLWPAPPPNYTFPTVETTYAIGVERSGYCQILPSPVDSSLIFNGSSNRGVISYTNTPPVFVSLTLCSPLSLKWYLNRRTANGDLNRSALIGRISKTQSPSETPSPSDSASKCVSRKPRCSLSRF